MGEQRLAELDKEILKALKENKCVTKLLEKRSYFKKIKLEGCYQVMTNVGKVCLN